MPEEVLDDLKNRLLEDKETYMATKKILEDPTINLLGLIDLVNDYIQGLFTEDQLIRVKDLMLLNEQKFIIDPVAIQVLMLEGKSEHAFKIIKDAISMIQLYFKKPTIGVLEDNKVSQKIAETQTCDDMHFEQVKNEIKK